MCYLPNTVCFYFTFTLTVLCNVLLAQKLEILPAQPEQTKPVGRPLLLTCKSDVSDAKLISELQWHDNKGRVVDKPVFGKRYPTVYTEVLPDKAVTLFITSLTEEMAGKYTCTANYANSDPLQASVVVKTIYPISWVDAPEKQYPIIHKDYKIRCEVQANPAPTVDWLKNGETITTSDKYVIEAQGLFIRDVQESDDGTYACRAAVISTGELDTRYISVEVLIPPTIEAMEPVEIVEGEQASIQCKAKGKPQPTFTWIKKNGKKDLSKTDRFSVNKNTGTLIINKVEQDDHSDYICVAENSAARAETTVKINVLIKPKIYDYANITAPIDKKTRIICKAFGRPLPRINFKKYGTSDPYIHGVQPQDETIIVEQENYDNKGEAFGVLSFTRLRRQDDGLYECIATNKVGETKKNGHVTVEFKPTFESIKTNLPIWSWNSRPVNLTCMPEAIPNATFEWRLNEITLKNDNAFKLTMLTDRSILTVNPYNEKYYTRYKCIATNKLGSTNYFVDLREAKVPGPVIQAKVTYLTATTIQFDITGPAVLDGLPVKAFLVQYKEEGEVNWDTSRNKTWSTDSPYVIEYLVPEKTYHLRFAAYNEVGLGGWGGTQMQTMSRRSAPNEPRILSTPEDGIVTSPYTDNFLLRWNTPADNGEPIDNYQVKFCPVRRVNGDWLTATDVCNTEELSGVGNSEYTMRPLSSDTHYKIELRAHNSIGYSTPAELIVKTARGSDTDTVYRTEEGNITSAAIIGIVIAAIIIIIVLVDLSCYCCNRTGILMAICDRTRKMPPDEEDPKLGSYKAATAHPNTLAVPLPVKLAITPVDEKEPLKPGDRTPMVSPDLKKNSTVQYDGTRVLSKTGEIIGKNSAV